MPTDRLSHLAGDLTSYDLGVADRLIGSRINRSHCCSWRDPRHGTPATSDRFSDEYHADGRGRQGSDHDHRKRPQLHQGPDHLTLIHISEPTRQAEISYAV